MKVSGFTFVRNAVKYDYRVVESIRSILSMEWMSQVWTASCDLQRAGLPTVFSSYL